MARAGRWERLVREHRAAVDEYVAAARGLSDAQWTAPRAPGKWSPAQITRHLAMLDEALLRELREGTPMRLRMTGLRAWLLRRFLLPHILFHRSIPLGAPAPREARPDVDPDALPARDRALEALLDSSRALEEEITRARQAGGATLTHPYFGALPLPRVLGFLTVHLGHHRRQLPTPVAQAEPVSAARER